MKYSPNTIVEKAIHHYKLPIPKIPDLYIYYINLFEPILKSRSIVEQAIKEIDEYDGEDYYENIRNTRANIIESVAETEAYKEFNASNNPYFYLPGGHPKFSVLTDRFRYTKNSDVYKQNNDGKYFVSVDMEKANFQITRNYDENILFGCKTYDEFIHLFTDSEYFLGSKYIRQIIFGNLAPKRQNTMQKYYTGKILESIIDEGLMPEETIRVYTADELVFNVEEPLSEKRTNEIKAMILNRFGFHMHVDSFKLKHVWNNCYVKEISDGSIKFKGVPTMFFPQVYKKYFGQKIVKNDLAFLADGHKAYLAESIDGEVFI